MIKNPLLDFGAERCGHNFFPWECPYEFCGYRDTLTALKGLTDAMAEAKPRSATGWILTGWIMVTKAGKPLKRNCVRIGGKASDLPKVKMGFPWKRGRGRQKLVVVTIERAE